MVVVACEDDGFPELGPESLIPDAVLHQVMQNVPVGVFIENGFIDLARLKLDRIRINFLFLDPLALVLRHLGIL